MVLKRILRLRGNATLAAALASVLLGAATSHAHAVGWGFDQLTISFPVKNLDDREGSQYRIATPIAYMLRDPLEIRWEGVLSWVEANALSGQPEGSGPVLGLDLIIERSFGPITIDGGAGLQRSFNTPFPSDGTNFNFTLLAGIYWTGFQRVSFGVRYFHVSNADVVTPNSGYDTIQGVLSYHWD